MRHPYLYDREAASDAAALFCESPSLTIQSEKDNCDINVIIKRFGVTGVVPQNIRQPLEGDFTSVSDFRTAMDAVVMAQRSFDQLDAKTRARFNNDPQLFLEFCSDKENLAEMRKMGLAVPEAIEPEVVPMKVEVVNPAPVSK